MESGEATQHCIDALESKVRFYKMISETTHEILKREWRSTDMRNRTQSVIDAFESGELRIIEADGRYTLVDTERLAVLEKVAPLLKWSLGELVDGLPVGDGEEESYIPDHNCDYSTRPDRGECVFHVNWFSAKEALAELDALDKVEP